jgi:hypothetical protein
MLQVPKSERINGGMDSVRHHKFPYSHQDASTSGGMNHGLDGIMGLRFTGATGGRNRRHALSGTSNLEIDYNQIFYLLIKTVEKNN